MYSIALQHKSVLYESYDAKDADNANDDNACSKVHFGLPFRAARLHNTDNSIVKIVCQYFFVKKLKFNGLICAPNTKQKAN